MFVIPVGPVHAGVIEPGHFRFSVAGEPIINLEIRMGYVHKGVEKLSEIGPPTTGGCSWPSGYRGTTGLPIPPRTVRPWRTIAGSRCPERAENIRTVAAGDGADIQSHRRPGRASPWTRRSACGGATGLHPEGDGIMDLNDWLTGSRFLRSVNVLGGVSKDITQRQGQRSRPTLVKMKLEFEDWWIHDYRHASMMDRIEITGTS